MHVRVTDVTKFIYIKVLKMHEPCDPSRLAETLSAIFSSGGGERMAREKFKRQTNFPLAVKVKPKEKK
jgi:hypothetical protein